MQKFIAFLAFSMLFYSGIFAQSRHEQDPERPQNGVVFKETVHNFKTVEYGDDVSYSFFFTNNSNSVIAVKDVKPSCACTVTEFTKGPIMPGKSGSVSIKYDSSREGNFNKTVTVEIGEENFVLTFLGTVNKAKTDYNIQPNK